MSNATNEPRRLEPGSYEYEFLYRIYEKPWEYPLPEDFDEIFAYIHTTILTERWRRILTKRLVERKTLNEIANEEGVTKERIRSLERQPFNIIRNSGWAEILIHGMNYYDNDSIGMGKMPIVLASYLMHKPITTRSQNALWRHRIRTLDDLSNAIRGNRSLVDIRGLGKKSMEEIRCLIDYYNLDGQIVSEPRRLEPDSYEYKLLYAANHGSPWEYPLPEDFDDAFAYVQSLLSEREQRIAYKRVVEEKTFLEIALEENVTKERIRQILTKIFRKIRWCDARNVLINGIKYYTKDEKSMMEMPEKLAEYLNIECPSTKTPIRLCREYLSIVTIYALMNAGKDSVEMLKDVSDDELMEIPWIDKNGLDEIKNLLDHYDFENHQIRD